MASAVCCTVLQHSCSVNRHSRPWGVRCEKAMRCAMSVPVPKKLPLIIMTEPSHIWWFDSFLSR